MYRREFLTTSIAGTAAFATLQARAFAGANEKPLRVALIGCGWYGKTDLLHLIQVAPVEVVALCDVDSQMLGAAADLVAQRQASKKRPATFSHYRAYRHARSLALPADGRSLQGRCRRVRSETDQL